MTALERYVLEYLSDRPSKAFEAQTVAEWIDKPLPKVTTALTRLRTDGFVHYFAGHPGAWSITAGGRAFIVGDLPPEPVDRYRLALQLIAENDWIGSATNQTIARRALS